MDSANEPILGWKLDPDDRGALLARFPPRYPRTVADHVTHGRKSEAPPMPRVGQAMVIGRADDGRGVEALVVALNGTSDRWDGSTYHITWSLQEGREAKESNEVIAARGWRPIADGARVGLAPAEWP